MICQTDNDNDKGKKENSIKEENYSRKKRTNKQSNKTKKEKKSSP